MFDWLWVFESYLVLYEGGDPLDPLEPFELSAQKLLGLDFLTFFQVFHRNRSLDRAGVSRVLDALLHNLNSIVEHLEVESGLYAHPEQNVWTQARQFHEFGLDDVLVGRGNCPGEFSS